MFSVCTNSVTQLFSFNNFELLTKNEMQLDTAVYKMDMSLPSRRLYSAGKAKLRTMKQLNIHLQF